MIELLPYEPNIYGKGVYRVKHISTKEKKYYSMLSYKSAVIIHPRPHKRWMDALKSTVRIVEKLRIHEQNKKSAEVTPEDSGLNTDDAD